MGLLVVFSMAKGVQQLFAVSCSTVGYLYMLVWLNSCNIQTWWMLLLLWFRLLVMESFCLPLENNWTKLNQITLIISGTSHIPLHVYIYSNVCSKWRTFQALHMRDLQTNQIPITYIFYKHVEISALNQHYSPAPEPFAGFSIGNTEANTYEFVPGQNEVVEDITCMGRLQYQLIWSQQTFSVAGIFKC